MQRWAYQSERLCDRKVAKFCKKKVDSRQIGKNKIHNVNFFVEDGSERTSST